VNTSVKIGNVSGKRLRKNKENRNLVMTDADRILAVMYVPLAGGIGRIYDTYGQMTNYFDDSYKILTIPTNEENPRIEVLNPRYVSKKEYNAILAKANKYLDDFNNGKIEQ